VAVAVGVRVALAVVVAVVVGVRVALTVPVAVAVRVMVAVAVTVTVAEALAVRVGVEVAVAVRVAEAVGVEDAVGVAGIDPFADPVSLTFADLAPAVASLLIAMLAENPFPLLAGANCTLTVATPCG
jgi:hypothetical protein